jgi:hypothetical protein
MSLPNWRDATAVIVASGPSASSVPLELAKGHRFIAVNSSWRLCPWADAVYAADFTWWNHCQGLPEFKGLKFTADGRAAKTWPSIEHVPIRKGTDMLIFDPPGTIGWGGNSGFQSINIAAQSGVTKIILVGFDMTLDGGTHWHGDHPKGMNNPRPGNIGRWRKAVDGAYRQLTERGVTAINCSPVSALQNYPKMSLREALDA